MVVTLYIYTCSLPRCTGPLESQATISKASSSLQSKEGAQSDVGGHSNSPTDSVALMIKLSTGAIQEKLEAACGRGVVDVFSTTGRYRTVFPAAFQEYSDEVSMLEDNVCRYLKVCKKHTLTSNNILLRTIDTVLPVCGTYMYYTAPIGMYKRATQSSLQAVFTEIGTSKRALDIISRFECVSQRAALREALHRCMLTAFSRYSLELEEIQATYEKHKVRVVM